MTYKQYKLENFNYEVITTFWEDFGIANKFGTDSIKDTFKRAFDEWKDNYKYLTELVIVLNDYCWLFYEKGNMDLSKLYADLYHEAGLYADEHLTGEAAQYYFEMTD